MKRYLPFIIIGGVLVLALAAGAILFRSSQPQPAPSTASVPPASTQSTPGTDAPAKGAVITIEEFGDYQCPPCGSLHPVLKKLKSEFGPRMRLVFFHLPLTQVHKNALDAAHAAIAAGLQGKFWEMHDKLYESQREWSEANSLRPYAANFANQLGLDVIRFARDMDSPQVEAVVLGDLRRANARSVNSTPTLFIDGQQIDNEKISLENLRLELLQRLNVGSGK
jgi:protein-disulfide isomerase